MLLGGDIAVAPAYVLFLRDKVGGNRLMEHNEAILRPDTGVVVNLATRLGDKGARRPLAHFTGLQEGRLPEPNLLSYVSPLGWYHIGLTGYDNWRSGAAKRTNARPLNLYPARIRA